MNKLWQLFWSFFKIGGLTFGGGMAMLPNLQHEVVDVHHWTTEEELLDIYAIGQCTPGIIAINTATFIGYKVAGVMGALVATIGEIFLPFILIATLANVLGMLTHMAAFNHAMQGVRAMVCALVVSTVWRLARKSIVDKLTLGLFALVLFGTILLRLPTVVCIIAAGSAGVIAQKLKKKGEEQ